MKRLFLSATLGMFFCNLVFTQTIYLDAVNLRKYVRDGKFDATFIDSVRSILEQYVEEEGETVLSLFKKNPYIKDFIDPTSPMSGLSSARPKGIFGKIGGIDVTKFAEGLAKFLVERTKQELSIAFFEDFKETINDDRYEDLRILFPNTAFLLQTIGEDIYKFSMYLQSLRESFIADLESLFDNFPEVIQKPKYNVFFEKLNIRYLKETLLCGLHITRGLRNEVHPGIIIETLPVADFIADQNAINLKALLQTIQLFSVSLRDEPNGDETKYWAHARDVYQLVQDQIAFTLYLGLLYERAKPIVFKDGTTFSKILADIKPARDSIGKYADFIVNLADKVQSVQQYMKSIIQDGNRSSTNYYNFFNSVIKILRQIDRASELPFLRFQLDKKYQQFVFIADHTNALYLDVNRKNYASAVMHTVSIFDTIIKPVYEEINGVIVVRYSRFRSALIKYGTFVAGVANAETSDDVQRAIETVALPVGSASIKKHSFFNVSLNAYVGPFVGSQKLASDKEFKTATGIFSPVGVAFSTSLGAGNRPSSISLFASVIDVGALTTFRFSNETDTLAGDVQIKLSQIVAPGIHLAFGLPRWPVSIGFGHHWLPLLSKVERSATTLHDSKGKRWQFFIAVDIPVLNFYNRSR